jgi:TaqI-like C-terminal specificity domain/Eco57I restriction-modification methylase
MAQRLLQLDDVRRTDSPQQIASLFKTLGYNAFAQQLPIDELGLSSRSAEAVWDAYLIADHQKGSESLQVLLFHLNKDEWQSPSVVSNRMRSLAQSLCRRPSNFLLLGTKDYNQMMLVNPRKTFDADMNLKVNIRKLLIDRINPTNYDRDRLEAIAARDLNPQELYKVQCEAFDVEKLTKEFYRGYREIFEEVQRVIKANNSHSYFEDKSRLHQFSQRFLGRVMFMYFLQKKGFLGGDRNFLKTRFPRTSELEDTDFYTGILEPVFFETLNKQRPNHESPWGQIPYLNGGLFDRDYGVDVKDVLGLETPPQIQLPNSLFDPSGDEKKSILKFFNGYNFTIAENVQGDEEAAVDPEMLGKVFENLLAADERGQSGTFYTPRGIVHFMCVESLSRYLADSTGMDVEAIKQLIEADLDLPDTDFNKLLTKEQAKKLKQALVNVKICDPAVGSGAFPLGMMQVMLAVRQAIARREGMTVQRGSLTISEWKRDIIANNLYGVDIKPEAIEIAKLRMWLSMVVDIPTIDDVEPLPNLDYKLMCGDSLISTINGEMLIPDPTKNEELMLTVTPVQSAIQPLINLQHQYFKSHADERKALRERIVEAEKDVFRVAIADRRQYWESKQRKLEQDIKAVKKASKVQTSLQQTITAKLRDLDSIAADVERGMRSLNFFQWHLHFNDVFKHNGGFDIVIGNPPYLGFHGVKNKDSFKQHFLSASGKFDFYVLFVEQGMKLLSSNRFLCFICPTNFTKRSYGKPLRKLLQESATIHEICDFQDVQIFDDALNYTGIFIFGNNKPNKNHEICYRERSLNAEVMFKPQSDLSDTAWVFVNDSAAQITEKISSRFTSPLSQITEGISEGIVTGNNSVFLLSRSEVKTLGLEEEVIRPCIRGRDIRQYSLKDAQDFVIYPYRLVDGKTKVIPESEMRVKFKATWNYLTQRKDELAGRGYFEKSSKSWYELWCQRDITILSSIKILVPELSDKNRFVLAYNDDFYGDTVCGITIKLKTRESLKYLLGILNSKLIEFYYKQTTVPKANQFYIYKTMFLKNLPIRRINFSDSTDVANYNKIVELVDKCLASCKANSTKTESISEVQEEISDLKREINQLVYQLYHLTNEEIETVEQTIQ